MFSPLYENYNHIIFKLEFLAMPGWLRGEHFGLMTWCLFVQFPVEVYFRLSPLQKHVRKVVCGFGKKSCVNTSVRKPGNTCASPTAMI